MKIGLRAHDYGKLPLQELMARISGDGFRGIQLAIPKAIEGINGYDQVDEALLSAIKDECKKHNIEIAVFGCYVELSYLDTKERQQQVDKFLLGIDFAKALDAGCIGSETTRFTGIDEERQIAFEGLVDSVKQIVKKAEEIGIDIGIEPVASHTLNTPELTKELLERVPSDRLKVIFDPVNLLTAENIHDQDNLWDRCFECFGDRICALHVKGIRLNKSGQLEKATLAESEVNLKKIMDWVKVHRPDISALREEIKPEESKEDWLHINSFL